MKLFVRVTPKAKRTAIKQLDASHYKVWVTAPPERGKANKAVMKLLADHFDIAQSKLELKTGGGSRDKIIDMS